MSSNTFPHNSHEHSNLRIKFLVFREKNKNGKHIVLYNERLLSMMFS